MRIPTQDSGPFAKVLAAIGGVILLVLGFMFSLVVLAIAVVAGLGIWAWFWWKTRKLRQQIDARMRENTTHARHSSGGDIIEGEAVIVVEEEASPTNQVNANRLPGSPDHRSPG